MSPATEANVTLLLSARGIGSDWKGNRRSGVALAKRHQPVSSVTVRLSRWKDLTSYRPRGDETMAVRLVVVADLRPSADGSAVRTSLVAGQAASLGSCATQPACNSVGWDRQTDGQTDRRTVSLNAPSPPYGGRHTKTSRWTDARDRQVCIVDSTCATIYTCRPSGTHTQSRQ